jgi:hypothetical protein
MGLIKKVNTAVAPEEKKPESGTDAAIARLQAQKPEAPKAAAPVYKQRDFDKEARGKTRCVQFEAALMSPAIAGMAFKTMKEYLALVREAADEGVKYSFEE